MNPEVVTIGLGYIGLPTSALIASHGTRVLGVDINQNIAVCGDWFIQGRVEAAFISGFEMATSLLNLLNLGEKGDK